MEKFRQITFFVLAIPVMAFVFACNRGYKKETNRVVKKNENNVSDTHFLRLKATIELPDVKGGFDLMSLDVKGRRLFVSAQDNHSLEVVDLREEKDLLSISNLNEPKWSFYYPEKNSIYVATGGDGKVTELDAATFKTRKEFQFKESCNNLRYDAETKQLYVGVGKSFGALGVLI